MAAVATRKSRVSKNKKKNWRKHINIDEVEEYLEDQRLQERTGGLVSEKSDDALFFIEKKGGTGKKLRAVKTVEPTRTRRRTKDIPLKCFEKLQPISSVKIPKLPRSELHRSLKQLEKYDKKIQRIFLNQKKKQFAVRKKSSDEKVVNPIVYDVWDDKADEIVFRKKNSVRGKLNINADAHFLRQTKKMDIKIPNTGTVGKKPSEIPSVEIPHPGASYNPTYEDHQELLQEAMDIEVQKEKKEKKITRALDEFFPSADSAPTDATRLKEMSAGIFSTPDDEESDEEPNLVSCGISYNPPVRREDKKTVTQRNREKRLKEKQKKLQELKTSKLKKNEIFRLKQLKREVNAHQKTVQERIKNREQKKRKAAFETRKLGKLKFKKPDIELKLGEELEGSLRLLKPEGNLLADRFKSLQKRNLIETRERAKNKRKYKPKEFEKKSHREVTL